MNDNDNMTELDINQLEEVTGGVMPNVPTKPGSNISGPAMPKLHPPVSGTNSKSNVVLNNMLNGVIKAENTAVIKPFEVCPQCHSTAVSFNREENICMCQDCGYCEDRSK